MSTARQALAVLCALALGQGCASGAKIRAEVEVLKVELERARRNGALRCAPRELATAEANLDFVEGELSEGNSGRAFQHVRAADTASKQALALTRECGPKRVLVRESLVMKIEETDKDGDGVFDKDDRCPDQLEDRDGFQDDDGCPDADNDGDGVLDGADRCPMLAGLPANQGCPSQDRDADGVPDPLDRCPDEPEDRDGYQDQDGCPDADNDNDGLVDGSDRCPNEAGPIAAQGCPATDKDKDGLSDETDKCPDEPEDRDGFQDDDGCPDLDNDSDGLPDAQDKCPNDAGAREDDGCPRKYKLVVVKKDRIEIKQQIKFRPASAKIVDRPSLEIIREVAQALKDHPEIKKLRVEGHTDSVGDDATNLRLSTSRAGAVTSALIKNGIDPGRLEPVGYGETRPIASNNSSAGRRDNRRTEFNIADP